MDPSQDRIDIVHFHITCEIERYSKSRRDAKDCK